MIYLMQGVWFQELSGLDIGFDHSGAIAVLRTQLCSSMFMGGFGPNSDDDPDELLGSTTDRAGEAELTHIRLSDTSLSFLKRYVHRSDVIMYDYKKQPDGTWEGTYVGAKQVGMGRSRCILTPVSDDFLVRQG